MDSWEWNKIAAAILSALVFVLVVDFAAETIFAVPLPAKPGYIAPEPPKPVVPPPQQDQQDETP
jgi:hypothetical protein